MIVLPVAVMSTASDTVGIRMERLPTGLVNRMLPAVAVSAAMVKVVLVPAKVTVAVVVTGSGL